MMRGWSASAPSRPQSFNVACAQGHRLRGERTEGYQALRCPTCGEGIFVLPRSPLPDPPRPTTAPRSRVAEPVEGFLEDDPLILTDPLPSTASVGAGDEPLAEIDWVDEIPSEPKAEPVAAGSHEPAPTAPPKPRPARSQPPRPAPPPAVVMAERITLGEWTFKHRNPLLFVGLLILIAGTVAIRRHRQRLDEYPKIVEIGRTDGLLKLDAGDFSSAKKLLADAADAVEGLGGRVEGSETIRQGAREAAIFADLAPEGLDNILEEAATGDLKEWPSTFAAKYKGRSIILDPPISEVPDPSRPGSAYEVTYPIFFGQATKPGKGRINLAGFRLFELSEPKVGEQKPFGARLASVELDVDSNEWVVTFEPESGTYITHPKALEAIAWPAPEPVEEPGP
jgi:DNA-directed RNA polymerase subunit RPC12/RpoP